MEPERQSSTKFTYEDFLQFPADGRRHELIDGEHYVTPSPDTRHQRIARRLAEAFIVFLRSHPAGEIFFAPFDVVISDLDVVEPDLLFIAADQAQIVTDKHVRGTPALVIEILSRPARERPTYP